MTWTEPSPPTSQAATTATWWSSRAIYTKEWSDGIYDYANLTAAPLDGYHANGFTNSNGVAQLVAYMAAYEGYNKMSAK